MSKLVIAFTSRACTNIFRELKSQDLLELMLW